MTVREAIADTAERLAAAGCSSPRLDAERLVEDVIGASRADLYASPERGLSVPERQALTGHVARRCRREPLAYILGTWDFRNLTLAVTPAVLVPRPETEVVVERCLEHIRPQRKPTVLDIGTGSGAIALAIVSEHRGARVTAVDISEAALSLAQRNARSLGLESRVTFLRGDLFAGEAGPFDLVVSNPPYVTPAEFAGLEPEIVEYEPRDAVLGSGFHRRIGEGARSRLVTDGWLVLECGEGEAPDVASEIESLGYTGTTVLPDLAGRQRVVEARWAESRGPEA